MTRIPTITTFAFYCLLLPLTTLLLLLLSEQAMRGEEAGVI